MSSAARTAPGGEHVVAGLLAHGVERVFCVPGESYLPVLDALYSARDRIELVSCRHESGAAFMAGAAARLTQRAGVVLVSRGPGATNAAIALHVARQASIPLVVGVGQVARAKLGRDALQEVDHEAFLRPLAKHVEQIDRAGALPAALARAFHIAESGRQGPVVLVLPEDVLGETVAAPHAAPLPRVDDAPSAQALTRVREALGRAVRPLVLAGGGCWSDAASADLARFAAANELPVMTAFRRQDLLDNDHRCFGGYLGLGAHPAAAALAAEADCVMVLGARLDEPTTAGYTLFDDDRARTLVHVYPDAAEIGRSYAPAIAVVAGAAATAAALADGARATAPAAARWCARVREAWERAAEPPASSAALDPGRVMQMLDRRLADDAVITIDAGNFTLWPQRYRTYRRPGRLLGPVNGAMGHAVPSAVGAALTLPGRQVVACVGDGGMLMTGMELATAARHGARVLVLVFNNGRYGTIDMHQQRRYPGRRIGNDLVNPDFAALARSFGLHGERIVRTADFETALDAALAAPGAALLELVLDEAARR